MQRETVWLVEDEQGIADTLVYMLQQEGFAVEVFERGLPVLDKARQQVPDVMILDVGLPDISGFELCRQLLALHPALPVLFLTARSEEVDRLLGLEIGADDYVAKPFSPREVCARVRTLLRRVKKFSSPSPVIRIGHFELNEPAAQISWFDTPLTLTRYEFLLLKTLLKSPGWIACGKMRRTPTIAPLIPTLKRCVPSCAPSTPIFHRLILIAAWDIA